MRKVFCVLIFFSLSAIAAAEALYVTDSFQITLRTGQGIEHKIVGMIPSGEKVEVIQTEEKWTKIKRKNGVEGWVLTRFLTAEEPSSIKFKTLNYKHENLLKKNQKNIEELEMLRSENSALKIDLKTIRANFSRLTERHSKLKNESADFLNLKEKYISNSKVLEEKIKKAENLETRLKERNIKIFVAGAVVMLIGFVIGLSAKRKKRGIYY